MRRDGGPTVSVSLLNYRGARFFDECLGALERLDPAPSEIVAVDNASPDGSGAELRARAERARGAPVRFVPSERNRGYAGGHNLGARSGSGDYIAFLNVTTVPEPGWLSVVDWMEAHPEVGFAMPAIFHRADPTRVESLGSRFVRSGGFRVVGRNLRERPGVTGPEYASEVNSVLGAAFVARRSSFERLGGFDESMFMYFEETDLCWRGWLRGDRSACWFDPARPTRVRHTMHGTHPGGFDVARYFEPNRTLSLFRNLEGRTLPWLLPQAGRVAYELAGTPRRMLRYGWDVARRLPDSAERRRPLQRERTVPDRRIFGLEPEPPLARWFDGAEGGPD